MATAKHLVAELNEIVAKATATAMAAERARIEVIFMSCRGSGTPGLFTHLVEDSCTEQQANDRIQDALAMRSDDQQIVSRIGGKTGESKKTLNADEIYARRKKQAGGK